MSVALKLDEEFIDEKLIVVSKKKNSARGFTGYKKKSPVYGECDPEKRTLNALPKIGAVVEVWDEEQYERGKYKVNQDGDMEFTHWYKVPYDGCKVGSLIKRFQVVGYTHPLTSNHEIASCKLHLECVFPESCIGITPPLYIPIIWIIYGNLEIRVLDTKIHAKPKGDEVKSVDTAPDHVFVSGGNGQAKTSALCPVYSKHKKSLWRVRFLLKIRGKNHVFR